MQTFGLPRQITRGAALASRLRDAERSEASRRRDAVRRWQGARRQGLSAADAAAAVGVSRATLYRWAKRAEPGSRRPRRPRRRQWTPDLVAAVQRIRGDYPQVGPMWGKARITILLRRDGHETSESTVGRILKTLMDQGEVTPVPSLRRNRPRAVRRARPYARRLPRGRKASTPGEIVQLDTLTVSPHPGQPAIKQFTACDPVAKWTCAQAWRRATAHNANVRRACAAPPGPRSRLTLDKLQADMPFSPQATSKPSRSTAAPSSRPTSKPNASAEASRCSNSLPDRPNSTDTSSATTAPGDTSSTPHGTSPTTTSTASTDGSTPSPTSPTPSDHARPLADKPQHSTLPNTQPKKPLHLIWPEPG